MTSMAPPNAVNCVKGEIHNVLSLMRLNRRWASEARFRHEIPLQNETPLLRSFKTLHNYLQQFMDLNDVDAVIYLRPFLNVIASKDTSGPLTEVALASVNKFLLYDFVHPHAPRAREAINSICGASTHCRFESSSSTEDEATLMKLLELLGNCLRCSSGRLLTDDQVWEMTQCCFRISRIERASHLLRKTAESTLTHIVLTIFSRIDDVADTHAVLTPVRLSTQSLVADSDEAISTDSGVNDCRNTCDDNDGNHVRSSHRATDPSQEHSGDLDSDAGVLNHENHEKRPYGSAVMARMLSWLSRMTDPRDHEVQTRIMGLRLINIVLETGGCSLSRFSSIVHVVQTELCKFLVQNSRAEDLTVLSQTLRVVFNLFNSLKEHLKVQLEVFFTSVHLYLADSPSARFEQKELALESLLEFCREPALMLDLYINYDCDVACTNLFETLCRCLCRNAVPENGPLTSLHVLSLEGVLAVIENMSRRCALATRLTSQVESLSDFTQAAADSDSAQTPFDENETGGKLSLQQLRERKQIKRRMTLAASRFNRDGIKRTAWIEYAQELGLLPSPAAASSVAQFFRECPGLDMSIIGDYLSQPDDDTHVFQAAVRKEYVASFDFRGIQIAEALRIFLACFRLPGESQKIERLMEAFARHYYNQSPDPMHESDTAFVLSYSIIMLFTDLHNPHVSKKMTLEEFIRNNRGIDCGEDLPREFLEKIYAYVEKHELKLKHDPSTLSSTNTSIAEDASAWDGVLARQGHVRAFTSTAMLAQAQKFALGFPQDDAGALDLADPNAIAHAQWVQSAAMHEKDMFSLVADATLGAISFVWENTADDSVLRKTMLGWRHAAAIASFHSMGNTLNSIIISLCKFFRQTVDSTLQVCATAELADDIVKLGAIPEFMYCTDSSSNHTDSPLREETARWTTSDDSKNLADIPDMLASVQHLNLQRVVESADVDSNSRPCTQSQTVSIPNRKSSVTIKPQSPMNDETFNDIQNSRTHKTTKALTSTSHSMRYPGTSFDAQNPVRLAISRTLMTLRSIFTFATVHANEIHDAWRSIVDIVLLLYRYGALEHTIVELDDFRAPNGAPLPSLFVQDTRVSLCAKHLRDIGSGTSAWHEPDDSSSNNLPDRHTHGSLTTSQCVSHLDPVRIQVGTIRTFAQQLGLNSGLFASLASYIWSTSSDDSSIEETNTVLLASLRHECKVSGVEVLFTQLPSSLQDNTLTQMITALLLARDPLSLIAEEVNEGVLAVELVAQVALRSNRRIALAIPLLHAHMKRIMLHQTLHVLPTNSQNEQVYEALEETSMEPQIQSCFTGIQYDGTNHQETDSETKFPFMYTSWDAACAAAHGDESLLSDLILRRQRASMMERSVVNLLRLVVRFFMEEFTNTVSSATKETCTPIFKQSEEAVSAGYAGPSSLNIEASSLHNTNDTRDAHTDSPSELLLNDGSLASVINVLRTFTLIPHEVSNLIAPRVSAAVNLMLRVSVSSQVQTNGASTNPQMSSLLRLLWHVMLSSRYNTFAAPSYWDAINHISHSSNVSEDNYESVLFNFCELASLNITNLGPQTTQLVAKALCPSILIAYGEADAANLSKILAGGQIQLPNGLTLASASPQDYYTSLSTAAGALQWPQQLQLLSSSAVHGVEQLVHGCASVSGNMGTRRWYAAIHLLSQSLLHLWGIVENRVMPQSSHTISSRNYLTVSSSTFALPKTECEARSNACKSVVSTLQRILLGSMGLSISVNTWCAIFNDVLLPICFATSSWGTSDEPHDSGSGHGDMCRSPLALRTECSSAVYLFPNPLFSSLSASATEDLRAGVIALVTRTFLRAASDVATLESTPHPSTEESLSFEMDTDSILDHNAAQQLLNTFNSLLILLVDDIEDAYVVYAAQAEESDAENHVLSRGLSSVYDSAWENLKNTLLVVASVQFVERMCAALDENTNLAIKSHWKHIATLLDRIPILWRGQLYALADQLKELNPDVLPTSSDSIKPFISSNGWNGNEAVQSESYDQAESASSTAHEPSQHEAPVETETINVECDIARDCDEQVRCDSRNQADTVETDAHESSHENANEAVSIERDIAQATQANDSCIDVAGNSLPITDISPTHKADPPEDIVEHTLDSSNVSCPDTECTSANKQSKNAPLDSLLYPGINREIGYNSETYGEQTSESDNLANTKEGSDSATTQASQSSGVMSSWFSFAFGGGNRSAS